MKDIKIDFYRDRFFPGFDKKYHKVAPSIILGKENTAYMFYGMNYLGGSDVHCGSCVANSIDGGKTFSEPKTTPLMEYTENGIRTIWGASVTFYHKKTGRFLCYGHTLHYADDKHPVSKNGVTVLEPYYAIFDEKTGTYGNLKPIPMPFETVSVSFHGQFIENEKGEILTSMYFAYPDAERYSVVTVSYDFDGESLKIVKCGEPLISGPEHYRGYCEPSVAFLNGKYYMTIRTDEQALLAVSDDGYTFSEPKPWVWNDGSMLENYNTMQRWVRFNDGLFLVYNRRGAHNDHIFRHRAPLFMARFNEDTLSLVRDSEIILVPEMGARLGNFNVTDVSENEAWVTVSEWMQNDPLGWEVCAKYGSDNTIWRTRVVKI